MTAHGSTHHRRVAKALVRKPTKVKALQERFSPTAIFPDPTDLPDIPDSLTDISIERPGHGHHQTPENATPAAPSTPELPPTSQTSSTSTSSIPTATPSTPSTPVIVPAPVSSIPTSSSTASSSIPTFESSASRSISSATSASVSAIPSASSTATPSSGVSTGAIVGGVGAGIVAIAVISFAVAFFFRRIRKRELGEGAGFDARGFRRSAVLLEDPPTHEDTVNRGYNPPPAPTMMEQRQHVPIPVSARGYAEPYYGSNAAGHGTSNQLQVQPSYSSGHVSSSNQPSPTGPSAHTLMASPVTRYVQNPIAPAPMPSPYEQSIIASVLTRQPSNGTMERQTMAQSIHSADAPNTALTRQPTIRSAQVPTDDYVDLSRSSVSPFQAAQYAEISRRLNSPPSSSASTPTVVSPAQIYATQQKDLPPVPPISGHDAPVVASPTASPFGDPEPSTPASEPVSTPTAVTPPAPAVALVPVQAPASPPLSPSILSVQPMHLSALSTDSSSQEELEFPVPPSPAISFSSRYRVSSVPPTLPEIQVQDRSSISSYIPGSPMIGTGYISGLSDASGASGMTGVGSMGLRPVGPRSEGKFVPAPSPLASSFVVASPTDSQEGPFAKAQGSALKQMAQSTTTNAPAKSAQEPVTENKDAKGKRPNTVYDPDDAYGGF
ncbi:hypothetical protein AN958_02888 [Leucoagaricus sp. SymC.cos]|nr:hypothetical protein AN958_02888 [Leucoagaricus sp. SymC.cos]